MSQRAEGLSARPDGSTFAYAVLLMLGALDAAAYSIIAPVVPAISASTGAGPALMGTLVAAFPVGIVVGFALAGLGIRRQLYALVLVLSLTLLAVGSLGFIAGDSLSMYFIARVVMGLGSGGLWMGVTFNTLQRWPGQEYLCMSRIFAAYSVGGLVGPALGAIGGVSGPFAAYLGLVLIGGLLVVVMGSSQRRQVFNTDRAALRLPSFWLSAAGILFAVLALGMVEGVLPLHLAESLTQTQIGLLYAVMSVVVAMAAAVAARFGPRRALLSALAFVVVGIAAVSSATAVPIWVASLVVAGAGIGLANTGSVGLLLEGIPTDRIVTAMVVWSQLGIAGYLLGPLAGGVVAQAMGFQALGIVSLAAAVPVLFLAFRFRPEAS